MCLCLNVSSKCHTHSHKFPTQLRAKEQIFNHTNALMVIFERFCTKKSLFLLSLVQDNNCPFLTTLFVKVYFYQVLRSYTTQPNYEKNPVKLSDVIRWSLGLKF